MILVFDFPPISSKEGTTFTITVKFKNHHKEASLT